MHVDEERKHVLTRVRKTKQGVKVKESDYNVLLLEFRCKLMEKEVDDKNEAYNLKNKKCQAKFKNYTSNTNMLSSTVNEQDDINDVIKRFIKKVDGCVAANFNKRRIKRKKGDNTDKLYEQMRRLKNKEDPESTKELAKCLEAIAADADKNYKKKKHELEKM